MALIITLYPIISTAYNEQHQSEIHTSFREQVAKADTAEIENARALAVAYNDAIANNVQLTENFSKDALLSRSGITTQSVRPDSPLLLLLLILRHSKSSLAKSPIVLLILKSKHPFVFPA